MSAGAPILSGRWEVTYDPAAFSFRQALQLLDDAAGPAVATGNRDGGFRVRIAQGAQETRYFRRGATLHVLLSPLAAAPWREFRFPAGDLDAALWPMPPGPVTLLSPRRRGDPRWRTIGLPPAALYLGSALRAAGWPVTALSWEIDGPAFAGDVRAAVRGVSVYEDQMPMLASRLESMRPGFAGLIAAGGPFVTLAPLAAAWHLPGVNLFVNGEAERVFPRLLAALFANDRRALRKLGGFLFQRPGLIWAGAYGSRNRMDDFRGFAFQTDFLLRDQLGDGLEMSFTRGCRRACLFCSHVHGRRLRRLPLPLAGALLDDYRRLLDAEGLEGAAPRSVNVNDDDILQDAGYAARVFRLIRSRGMRIWGVQTSPISFVDPARGWSSRMLELVSDPGLYVGDQPLLWLGSDVFHPARARRLVKGAIAPDRLEALVAEFERRRVRNYHYWISSDAESNWDEFVRELAWLERVSRRYPHFGLLAHAPFLIPYASAPIFRALDRGGRTAQIRLRARLAGPGPAFGYPLVEKATTPSAGLNQLLGNESPDRGAGFFDFLRARDYHAAAKLAYHFLRQDQLQGGAETERGLEASREALESILSQPY